MIIRLLIYFFNLFIVIEVELIYNVALVSGVPHGDSIFV